MTNIDLTTNEKFLLRYHRVPERALVWRGTMFIETVEGER